MTEHSTHDVVVVGARAAGAATAMLLARAGLDVLVVDRSRYGSDTLSTHALMRTGVVQLHRWGLLDDIIAAGTPAVRSTTFKFADEEVRITIKPSHGVDALYAPRRTVLDPILVDAARAAGASFAYGTSITDVVRDRTGRVVGVDGPRRPRTCGATHRPLDRGCRRPALGRRRRGRVDDRAARHWGHRRRVRLLVRARDGQLPLDLPAGGVRRSHSDERRSHVRVRGVDAGSSRPGWPGCAPCRSFAPPSPSSRDRLVSATPLTGVRTFGGLPGYMRVPWGPGWALVGDAAYWKDPLGAHGLTDALRDAEILARAIIAVTLGDAAESDALDDYHRTRNRLSLPLFDVVDTIATMRWTDAEIPELLRQLSSTMSDEVEFVARLDDEPAVSGAPR